MEHITFKNALLLLLSLFGIYGLLRLLSLAIAKSWFQAKKGFEETQKEVQNGKEEKT